jgi:hypothetical protein
MNQLWVGRHPSSVRADGVYVPIDENAKTVGAGRFFREGEQFPESPAGVDGWAAERDLAMFPPAQN